MKVCLQLRIVCLIALGSFVLPSSYAGIISGDFEAGDFTGWSINTTGGGFFRPSGAYIIDSSAGHVAEVYSEAGPSPGQNITSLSQEFSASEFQQLQIDARSSTFGIIPGGYDMRLSVIHLETGQGSSRQFFQNDPWQTYTMPLSLSGNYRITARSEAFMNFTPGGALAGASLFIDNLRLIPEPSEATIIIVGLIVYFLSGTRRRYVTESRSSNVESHTCPTR